MARGSKGNVHDRRNRPSLNDFQWLVSLIRRLRPDLCKLFKTDNAISLEFAKWLILDGAREYRSLAESNEFRKTLCKPLRIFGLSPLQALIYRERPDVGKAFPLPERKQDYLRWFYRHGVIEHKLEALLDKRAQLEFLEEHPEKAACFNKPKACGAPRPFGVNLIGYAYGQLGIGEDLRMTAKALQAANVPCGIINFPPGRDIPQNDFSLAHLVSKDGRFCFNLFCMTALETGRYLAERGTRQLEGRYNIGYWPWELAKWPDEWLDLPGMMDEIWVSSRHVYDSLASVSPAPVLVMPLTVETGDVANLRRKDFGLPDKTYLFCFSFDLNSSIHRKNPEACIKSFQRAFPQGEGHAVGLVIKCHAPKQANPDWENLKKAAACDSRIYLIEQTLPRPVLMALYKNCDCYLSLHRAEGYGRGIVEALLLGLRVIATDYSGNVDYCRLHPNAMPAPYKLVPVAGKYSCAAGQVWADVIIDKAAELMRAASGQPSAPVLGHNEQFSSGVMGKLYANRLRLLKDIYFAEDNLSTTFCM